MSRLTARRENGTVDISLAWAEKYTLLDLIDELADALCAYEDTLMTPEQIKEVCDLFRLDRAEKLRLLEKAEEEGRLLVLPRKPENLDLRRVIELIEADSIGHVQISAGPGDRGEQGPAVWPTFSNGDALLNLIRVHLAEIVAGETLDLSQVFYEPCSRQNMCQITMTADCLKCVEEWLRQLYTENLRWEANPRRIEATAAGQGEDPWTLLHT